MITRLAAMLAVWLWASPAGAQYRFDHWTADNGLPQNSVRDILQTEDGYLWFTTFDGLVRFDGVRFTVFNKTNSPDLPGSRFVDLFEDRSGDLWATLQTGQVVWRQHGRFVVFPHEQESEDDMRARLSDDGQGNVVVNYHSWEYEATKNVLIRITSRAYRCRDGRLEPAEELNHSFPWQPIRGEIPNVYYWGLFDGDLWLCTDERVIRLMKDGGVRVFDERNGLPGTRPGLVWGRRLPMRAVSRDAAGRLWLTELESGQSQLLSLQTPDGFDVRGGYADAEGNYWFATYNNGLFRARRETVTAYAAAQGLDAKEIYPLLETRDGSLWIGAGMQGLFRLKDGAFTRYRVANRFTYLLNSLYEDRSGQLWVNGAWRFVDGHLVGAPWTDTLPDTSFLASQTMCEDRDGGFWVGASSGVACHRDGVSTYYTTRDGLAGNDTKVIIEDGRGGLWLGSFGGLTHYQDGKFTAWTERDGLPGDTVRALKQDADGTLWIGTYDGGLGRFKDGRFTAYTVRDGLFDNGVFQILEDDSGWFWMSCNRGIYRVRKQELNDFAEGRIQTITCLAYNKSDGMPSSECNGGRWPAGVKTRDGRLWFPTMGGVAMIDPAGVKTNAQPPPVVIEAMRINNEPVPPDAWESALRNSQSAIEIMPGQDNFEVEYTALSFINSENTRFKYMLEGADADWVEAGTRRTAYFSHLAPGDYTFRVIAANADGVWNEAGASVRITIVPPFWRTWWFFSLVSACAVGAVFLVVRRRVSALRRQREELEATVAERTAALAATVEQLQQSERRAHASERSALEASAAKSVFLSNMSHELRTPLNAVLGFAQLIARDRRIPPEQQENLAIVHRSGEHLLGLINDVLSISKIEAGKVVLEDGVFKLPDLLEGVCEMMRNRAEAKGLELVFDPGAVLPDAVTGDEGKLRQVLVNLLGNAVKFTDSGSVTLHVRWGDGRASFSVVDTGVGIADEDLDRLFDAFVQTESGQRVAGGTGLGLAISRQIVRLMGGDIHVESRPGVGSRFSFDIALPESQESVDKDLARVVERLAPGERARRILIVDDVTENRLLLTRMLAVTGSELREAVDGAQAIEVWREWQPELVFTDLRMPQMDGHEVTRRIRELEAGDPTRPRTVVVALTASAFEHQRDEILAGGADDFVAKPFREARIFEVLVERLGMQFVYAEAEPAVAPAAGEVATPERLAAVPDDVVKELRRALYIGDDRGAMAVLERVREHDGALAEQLGQQVRQYQFERVLELIGRSGR